VASLGGARTHIPDSNPHHVLSRCARAALSVAKCRGCPRVDSDRQTVPSTPESADHCSSSVTGRRLRNTRYRGTHSSRIVGDSTVSQSPCERLGCRCEYRLEATRDITPLVVPSATRPTERRPSRALLTSLIWCLEFPWSTIWFYVTAWEKRGAEAR